MKIGIPKEIYAEERRVACVPAEVAKLNALGYEVCLEKGAGRKAGYLDREYEANGAQCIQSVRQVWAESDIILKVRAPMWHDTQNGHESDWLNENKTLISFIWPAQNPELLKQLAKTGANVLAMDSVPRISRAQKSDALSSMANISGYRAVLVAGNHFGRFFTGQITAAGRVEPAKLMVIGAGVAGLAAIGTAVNMGAMVSAFDTRPEVKEQIESMNAKFLMLEFEEDGSGAGGYAKVMSEEFIKAEMDLFAAQARQVDIIITTALIPGKPAPKLITKAMVDSMKPGSVVVDLAAEQGGNCEYTKAGEVAMVNDVSIIGYTDLPSQMASQSSQLYSANLRHLLEDLTPDKQGQIVLNLEDEVIRGTTVVTRGEVIWPAPAPKIVKPKPVTENKPSKVQIPAKSNKGLASLIAMLVTLLLILAVGSVAPKEFMSHFIVFVLSCFVGWQVIWNVTPALHTPLMSVTNAISGIIVIGALSQVNSTSMLGSVLGLVAVLIATINISGGFLVTQRMLKMFRKP